MMELYLTFFAHYTRHSCPDKGSAHISTRVAYARTQSPVNIGISDKQKCSQGVNHKGHPNEFDIIHIIHTAIACVFGPPPPLQTSYMEATQKPHVVKSAGRSVG